MKVPSRCALVGLALACLAASPSTLSAAERIALQSRVAATQRVGFDVYVPIQHRDRLERELAALHDPKSPSFRKWLTPEQFRARYGATDKQLTDIRSKLAGYGLESTIVGGHHVHVTGDSRSVEKALGTRLMNGTLKSGKSVVEATGRITPPNALVQTGAVIVGLKHLPMPMKTHSHYKLAPMNRYGPTGGYWFTDLKQAYSFPSYQALTGKGVTIATMTDGAYLPVDMVKYFSHEKLEVPQFSEIDVDGGSGFNGDSIETELDMQQAGGMAPNSHVIHYNLPDLYDQSIIDGLLAVVTDNVADIVSMSFGLPEPLYTASFNDGTDFTFLLTIENDLMAQGNAQGITFIASSGDSGARSLPPIECFTGEGHCGSFRKAVNFPASSPHVTGVGGTNLITTFDGSTRNSAYVREQAFADPLSEDIFFGTEAHNGTWGSGGGNSIIFNKPSYQAASNTGSRKFRTVPDLALHMGGCPSGVQGDCNPDDSAVLSAYNNEFYYVIGTSASAPDFAGLTALEIEQLGSRVGNSNYYIYALANLQASGYPIKAFKENVPGYNGLYYTTPTGYNRVLGNGTLNGVDFLLAPNLPVSGVPLTRSNP